MSDTIYSECFCFYLQIFKLVEKRGLVFNALSAAPWACSWFLCGAEWFLLKLSPFLTFFPGNVFPIMVLDFVGLDLCLALVEI